MALLQVNTFSQALSRIITFHIILPNDAPPEMLAGNSNYDRPMKTLYLLHGFSGSTQDWLTGSLIQELALKYNLAVVMPAGENSFYLNGKGTGRGYETFTAVELPAYCQKTFGLSAGRQLYRWIVHGWIWSNSYSIKISGIFRKNVWLVLSPDRERNQRDEAGKPQRYCRL